MTLVLVIPLVDGTGVPSSDSESESRSDFFAFQVNTAPSRLTV